MPAIKPLSKLGKTSLAAKKPIVAKSIHLAPKAAIKPIKLVQVSSDEASKETTKTMSDSELKSLSEVELRQKLDELLSTQQKLHHISAAISAPT